MEDALSPLGFRLSMAETGELALAFCQTDSPDLALVDQAMPGLSGTETCQRIRHELGLNLPLIIVSANADAAPGRFMPAACYDAYLSKPVNVNQLLDLIGEYLYLSWTYQGAEDPASASPTITGLAARELSHALSIGHVAAVRDAIERAAMTGDASSTFVTRARDLAEHLDLQGLRRLVDEARDAI